MEDQSVTACAEFPNDNPALHDGAIWVCLETTAAASCERPSEPLVRALEVPVVAVAGAPADEPPVTDEDPGDDIEIVDELPLLAVVEEPGAPEVDPSDPFAAFVAVLEGVARAAGAAEAALGVLRVALGRERAAADATEAVLGLRTQAAAWQAILRGEGENWAACGGAPLDEWSATVVAAALGPGSRAEGLRRELRARGIAAFGLVVEAA